MQVVILAGEQEQLAAMNNGFISPECESLFKRVRRNLLEVGDAVPMDRRMLAVISALADVIGGPAETRPTHDVEPPANGRMVTPNDEADWDKVNYSAATNGNHEYTGVRIKWATEFKSTPRTPINKLEKGRPVTYLTDDGERLGARFVRMDKKDKHQALVANSTKKIPFRVPVSRIEVTDLKPPSRLPAAVQV